jgi:P-type Cu2+ transporter
VQSIAAAGCSAYYGRRAAYAQKPPSALANPRTLEIYDHPALQRTFVYPAGPSGRLNEAAILLEGLTCGACVWLIERRLAELDGVQGVTINYATRRARIRWDEARVKLSTILRTLTDLGFFAQPYDRGRAESALASEERALLWRLALAAAAMMQAPSTPLRGRSWPKHALLPPAPRS